MSTLAHAHCLSATYTSSLLSFQPLPSPSCAIGSYTLTFALVILALSRSEMEKHTDNPYVTENGGKMPELAAGEGFTIVQAPSCPSYEYPDDLENELFAPAELVDKGEERIELAADHTPLPEFVKRQRSRNKYRYNIYRLDEEEGKKQYVYHARKPNMDLVHAHTHRSRPRYLYRVWCSASAGYNSDGEFKSGAAHNGVGAQDMALWKAPEMQHHLLHHVSGMRNGFQSHFISFTNSGLFAECKATKRKEMNKKELKELLKKAEGAQGGSKTDSEIDVTLACQIAEAKESLDVRISMIDIHDFPDDVVMFNAQALMRAHNLEETSIGVTGPAHHSEFLIWDGLKVPMQTVSLSTLCTPVIPGENRLTTQFFHELPPHIYQTIDKFNSLKRKREEEARTAPNRTRKPSQIRPALYDGPEVREAELQIRSSLVKGHRKHYEENMANAISQGTKNHKSFNRVTEGSFGAYDLRRYIAFLQNRFKPKYQLPMLAMMLSLRTAAYFEEDIKEEVKRVRGKTNSPVVS